MRVWTIQPEAVWETVQRHGVARVDPVQRSGAGYIHEPLSWLMAQLEARRGWTPGCLPWWAYCAKPDLRCHRHIPWVPREQVRLELEIPDERLFVMPCWAWDTVFRQDFLAFSVEEHRDWTERMRASVPLEPDAPDAPDARDPVWPLPEPWRSELHASWERLFDPDLPAAAWSDGRDKSEAVFEEIRAGDVRKASPFLAAAWRGGCAARGVIE